MVNAMNTSDALSDLLCQGNIPRLLNQELKERKLSKRLVEAQPKVPSSSFVNIKARSSSDSKSDAYDPNQCFR
jgi:hypothetical protein